MKYCAVRWVRGGTWSIPSRMLYHQTGVNIGATYIAFFFEWVFVTKCHFFWVKKKFFFFIFFYSKKNENFFIFFDSKKIVAFAFHFLSDFSRQSKSKISFFPFVKILSRKNLLICFSLSLRFFSPEKIDRKSRNQKNFNLASAKVENRNKILKSKLSKNLYWELEFISWKRNILYFQSHWKEQLIYL